MRRKLFSKSKKNVLNPFGTRKFFKKMQFLFCLLKIGSFCFVPSLVLIFFICFSFKQFLLFKIFIYLLAFVPQKPEKFIQVFCFKLQTLWNICCFTFVFCKIIIIIIISNVSSSSSFVDLSFMVA